MWFIKKHIFFYLSAAICTIFAAVFCAGLFTSVSETAAPADIPVTVVIDPGHGGEDGGAVCFGVSESGINLAVSKKLDSFFHLIGIKTVMTRSEDISLHSAAAKGVSEKKVSDLKNRVSAVNAIPNAVLVSIHQNQFEQEKYDGAQVFYSGSEVSRTLAEQLQKKLREGLDPDNRREARPAETVYLLKNASCPAVLVECGFLSNRAECTLLCSESYQRRIAVAIGAALAEYIKEANEREI